MNRRRRDPSRSSFIVTIESEDRRTFILDLRSGEQREFASLEAAWSFLKGVETRLGLK